MHLPWKQVLMVEYKLTLLLGEEVGKTTSQTLPCFAVDVIKIASERIVSGTYICLVRFVKPAITIVLYCYHVNTVCKRSEKFFGIFTHRCIMVCRT